jgi:hypothetical protein
MLSKMYRAHEVAVFIANEVITETTAHVIEEPFFAFRANRQIAAVYQLHCTHEVELCLASLNLIG